MAHRRARDLLAAMTAFAGTDNFVEARFHLQFQDVRICCIESLIVGISLQLFVLEGLSSCLQAVAWLIRFRLPMVPNSGGNSQRFLYQGRNPSARDFVKKALGTCK